MPVVTGTPGPNTLTGDFIWREDLQQFVYAETADEIFGYGGDDSLYGGALNDVLWGGDGNDYMVGETGDDILHGEADDDNMGGGAGHDVMFGDGGNDTLYGDIGHDAIFGGAGNDHIVGGTGDGAETEGDELDGGEGDDWIFADSGPNIIQGGEGTDTAHVFFIGQTQKVEFVALVPGAAIVPLVGGKPYGAYGGIEHYGNIWGGKGDDLLGGAYSLPAGASFTLQGMEGDDTAVIDVSAIAAPMQGGFSGGYGSLQNTATGGSLAITAEHLRYTGNALEGVYAGDGNDTLTGMSGADIFGGGDGHDTIDGAAGGDTLYGGDGDDTLTGGTGEDWIDGQTGTDTAVYAGAFADYSFSPQADRLRVTSKGGETDQLFGIERLRFSDGTVVVRPDFTIGSSSFAFTTPSVNKPEGTGGTTAFAFTVTRSGDLGIPQSIGWSAAGSAGTGTVPAAAADFAGGILPAGTLSFAAGQASATLTVNVAADSAVELNERFAVTLGAPPLAGVVVTGTAHGIIRNDDTTPPTASFAIARLAASRAEGSSGGTTPFTFTVTRAGNTATAHSIAYAVAGIAGTGTMPASAADFADAALPAGRLTFAPGETSRVLTIPVAADLAGELNERFAVTLSAPSSGAVLGSATSAGGIIVNDDTSLAFATAHVSRLEGNAGSSAYSFTVSRSGATTGTTTVDWSFAGGGVAGTVAANAADFAGGLPPGGTLTFAPNQTARTITIPVLGDTNPEGGFNESFTLTLANASGGAAILGAKATGTIREDDTIYGTTGNDSLFGTAGGDLFVIGQGQDTIMGGNGVDSFRFLPSAAAPGNLFTLADFDPFVAERIDLSRIDAIAGTLANDPFTFIGPMPLTLPGQLHWERLSPHLVEFQGNLNADPAPELRFVLFSPGTPDSTWFVL